MAFSWNLMDIYLSSLLQIINKRKKWKLFGNVWKFLISDWRIILWVQPPVKELPTFPFLGFYSWDVTARHRKLVFNKRIVSLAVPRVVQGNPISDSYWSSSCKRLRNLCSINAFDSSYRQDIGWQATGRKIHRKSGPVICPVVSWTRPQWTAVRAGGRVVEWDRDFWILNLLSETCNHIRFYWRQQVLQQQPCNTFSCRHETRLNNPVLLWVELVY